MANLRIIYRNVVDELQSNGQPLVTLSASSTAIGTAVSNLKSDKKGLIWRSTNKTPSLSLSFATATKVGGVVIPFCNLTTSATISITTNAYSISSTLCSRWERASLYNWGSNPNGANTYAYGGGTYARVWVPDSYKDTAITSMTISISDSSNTDSFIEASRLIIGPYWSPEHNTNYGLSMGIEDTSSHQRTQSGDIYTTIGPRYGKMSFELSWLSPNDRKEFLRILKNNGLSRPLFVSLFPNDTEYDKEGAHQLYGKLSNLSSITHTYYEFYSGSIELEEI